ncbi:phosphatase PAP2 family protein [Demequina aestuarii]|uniref:phosphatase PAP2 family protein n=1 Tax=Demequina aestuarii TaxID=327095 RepID=UPI000A04CF27|nr:phosphatase PAP2 family protein [Demequina aestuarii]
MIRDAWTRLPPLVRAVVPGLMLVAVGAWGFVAVLDEVLDNDILEAVDQPLIEWLVDNRVEWLTTLMTAITETFGPVVLPVLILIGCALWVWRTRSWRDPLLLAGSMVLATGISMLVKMIVARARPDAGFQTVPGYETSFSFPSGHTTGAATLVLVTGYLLWHRRGGVRGALWWVLGSVLLIALVGGTRLYLGYHFLSDVLAGACVGVVVLGLVVAVDRWLDLREASRASAAPAAP